MVGYLYGQFLSILIKRPPCTSETKTETKTEDIAAPSVLKSLLSSNRIFMDMQQSEIIVNYLAEKYTDEPENKQVKFSTIR